MYQNEGARENMKRRTYNIPVSNGILARKHMTKIGEALWLFLWCIDKTTKEIEGRGLVYGGMPIKSTKLAKELNKSPKTIDRWLNTLRRGHYIKTVRTSYGLKIAVNKSKKFNVGEGSFMSERRVINAERRDKNDPNIVDITEDITNDITYNTPPLKTVGVKKAIALPPNGVSDSVSTTNDPTPQGCPETPLPSLIKLYVYLRSQNYGERWGKIEEPDIATLELLLKRNGEDVLRKAINTYFQDNRDCICAGLHSVEDLRTNFRRYQ